MLFPFRRSLVQSLPYLAPAAALAVAIALSLPASAENYKADVAHSSVNFEIKHLFSKVRGKFKDYSGSFNFDEKKPEASKAEFSIKTTSIDTDNGKRDDHLRGPDFFDAAKHPEITFKSKTVTAAGKGKYKLAGDLTMLGKTESVTFDVEFLGAGKDGYNRELASFTATGTINRKKFGMVWNQKLDTGGVLLGDDVKIEVNIEGEKVKAEAAAPAAKKGA